MARPPKMEDDEVLDRAIDAFLTQGWSATSIRDLERLLELKAPSIYRRYGSKGGLARAVLQRYIERIIDGRIAQHLTGHGDPLANVAEFLRSGVTTVGGEPLRGCLLTITALDAPSVGADLSDLLVEGFERIEAALEAELGRAEAGGLLTEGLTAEVAAGQLFLAFQGLMVLARAGVAPKRLQARAIAAIAGVTG